MKFSNYANRIKSLVNFDNFEKPSSEYKNVARFTVKKGDMVKTVVNKTICSQLNDKRFYFPDDILSLPYDHQILSEIDEFKKQTGQKIQKYFREKKDKLLKMEKKALKNKPRLYLYHQILMQQPRIVNIKQKVGFEPINRSNIKKSIKDIVLIGEWMK